jgi:N-acetylglucosaminyl-diphospho-decaprenol L-rhamnosyltransferase
MDVSVVVLTWEDVERTTACVKSLPAEAEIVVVDNGSRAEIEAGLRELCTATGARYVRSATNLGYAKGMNLGVRHTGRGVVVLANNDVLADADALHRLARSLEDPTVGAAFPSVRNGNGEEETGAGRFLTVPIGLGHLTGLGLVLPALRITTSPEHADWLSGPFVALRRETLERVGGVDESAFFYSEDLRLCWAVRQLGLRLAYLPDAVIVHENDTTSRRVWAPEEIARRKTREFIRASRDQGAGLACRAYAAGAVVRAMVAPTPVRRAVARGAIEGLRAAT